MFFSCHSLSLSRHVWFFLRNRQSPRSQQQAGVVVLPSIPTTSSSRPTICIFFPFVFASLSNNRQPPSSHFFLFFLCSSVSLRISLILLCFWATTILRIYVTNPFSHLFSRHIFFCSYVLLVNLTLPYTAKWILACLHWPILWINLGW